GEGAAVGVRLDARGRGERALARLLRPAARAPRPAPVDRTAVHRARATRPGPRALAQSLRAAAHRGGRSRIGDRARHHRRAGPRLSAGNGRFRRGKLRAPRRAEHPRARGLRQAGAVRSADGELPGQRAGAGGPRGPPGQGPDGAVAPDARPARAARGDPQARGACAGGGVLRSRRVRPRRPPDRGAAAVNFWWRAEPPAWSAPLQALVPLWAAGTAVHRAVSRPLKVRVPVISIGNLTVGGAGKTPVTLHLAQRLAARGRRPAVLSRGYGR